MALISIPNTFQAGAVIVASEHNANFSTIVNDYNGNITNANISASAAIADTKLASISTAGKVNISALTVASQAAGDIIVASSASAWARKGMGTANQLIRVNSGATDIEYFTPAATQAEMEAASSTTVYATPGRVQYHPGVVKGWIVFAGDGSATTGSHNVTSLTDTGTGDFLVTWATDFSGTNYAVLTGANATVTTRLVQYRTKAAGTTQIIAGATTSDSPQDITEISVAAVGDQ